MRIILTGASGLIGRALTRSLRARGDTVVPVSRTPGPGGIAWDVDAGKLEAEALAGADAVIHLAGENVAGGRWSEARRRAIRESRVAGTRLLVDALSKLDSPPPVLVSASAVGFYGPEPGGEVDESAPAGRGFLAEVCVAWETEAHRAESLGIRVVNPRFGVVLSPEGGALAKMLPLFRQGLGGPVGDGKQRLGWIALDDAVAALVFLVGHAAARGPVNVTAPEIISNREFATTLGGVLGRPARVPVPLIALRLAFGQMAVETVCADAPARPEQLRTLGFGFRYPRLKPALEHLLGQDA